MSRPPKGFTAASRSCHGSNAIPVRFQTCRRHYRSWVSDAIFVRTSHRWFLTKLTAEYKQRYSHHTQPRHAGIPQHHFSVGSQCMLDVISSLFWCFWAFWILKNDLVTFISFPCCKLLIKSKTMCGRTAPATLSFSFSATMRVKSAGKFITSWLHTVMRKPESSTNIHSTDWCKLLASPASSLRAEETFDTRVVQWHVTRVLFNVRKYYLCWSGSWRVCCYKN